MSSGLGVSVRGTGVKGRGPWYHGDSELAQSLVGLWKLDESSGSGLDQIGTSHLQDSTSTGSSTGILYPLARQFNGSSNFLNVADNEAVSTGNIDLWISLWLKPTTIAVTNVIVGKWNTSGNREWQLAQVNDALVFQVSPNGTATGLGTINYTGALAANIWTLVTLYHDSVNDLIGMSLNGAPFVTVAYSGGLTNLAGSLTVGKQTAASGFFTGQIQRLAMGKGYIPTFNDANFLWNVERDNGVESIRFIGHGGEVDWSPDGEKLVFDRRDLSGIYQIYTCTPTGRDVTCLTDPAPTGGPTVDLHKGFPSWHPSGEWIVMSGEMPDHIGEQYYSEPGRGMGCDLYIMKSDGSISYQMTNYNPLLPSGVLNPRFNKSGNKIVWAKTIGVDQEAAPYAIRSLVYADFAVVDDEPTISNLVEITPGNSLFYESHGFTHDDHLLFTADNPVNEPDHALDIYIYELPSGPLINLTDSSDHWDEHAHQHPTADVIVWASSMAYPGYVPTDVPTVGLSQLRLEATMMNQDGSFKQQLTRFNIVGAPEYSAEHTGATVMSWHPDGSKLAIAEIAFGANFDTFEGRKLWILTFNKKVT